MDYPLPNGQSVDYATFVAGLKKPGDAILTSLDADKCDAWHMASCIPGEAGELMDCLAVHLTGGTIDRDNLIEELGDLEFYMEGLRGRVGINRAASLSGAGLSTTSTAALLYALPGLAAEVFDVSKRWIVYGKDLDKSALALAIGRLDVALQSIGGYFGLRRDDWLAANVGKLGKRYQTLTYSDQEAQDRADKQEKA